MLYTAQSEQNSNRCTQDSHDSAAEIISHAWNCTLQFCSAH
eukprot:COSAG02_NODE_59049_length_275_cov_0.880682_1_plen_40_part_01